MEKSNDIEMTEEEQLAYKRRLRDAILTISQEVLLEHKEEIATRAKLLLEEQAASEA